VFDDPFFSEWFDINIIDAQTGRRLLPDETLEGAEIWDGSILTVVMAR